MAVSVSSSLGSVELNDGVAASFSWSSVVSSDKKGSSVVKSEDVAILSVRLSNGNSVV